MGKTRSYLRDPVQTCMKNIYKYNLDLFKDDSEEKYYIIGFIAADGWISDKSSRIEITLAEKDRDFLEQMKNLICPDKKLSYKQTTKAYRLTLDHRTIHDDILHYINTTDKSYNLVFPHNIPKKYLTHYMRGYSDGDGTIGVVRGQKKVQGQIKYYYGLRYRVLGTKPFLLGWEHVSKEYYAMPSRNVHKKGQENVFYIEYGFASAERFLELLYKDANLYLKRKHDVYKYILSTDSEQLQKNFLNETSRYNTQGIPQQESKI